MPEIFDATGHDFDARVFEVRGQLVVVDFWAPGCPNCAAFAGDAQELVAQLPRDGLRLVRVDVQADAALAERFGLVGVPCFLLVRDGEVLGRMSRYYGREHWLDVVRAHLVTAASP